MHHQFRPGRRNGRTSEDGISTSGRPAATTCPRCARADWMYAPRNPRAPVTRLTIGEPRRQRRSRCRRIPRSSISGHAPHLARRRTSFGCDGCRMSSNTSAPPDPESRQHVEQVTSRTRRGVVAVNRDEVERQSRPLGEEPREQPVAVPREQLERPTEADTLELLRDERGPGFAIPAYSGTHMSTPINEASGAAAATTAKLRPRRTPISRSSVETRAASPLPGR